MTAVRLVIIQMGLTHAPVTVATQEMDEPAMVNKLLDQMHRFHKKIFHKSRYANFGFFSRSAKPAGGIKQLHNKRPAFLIKELFHSRLFGMR